MQKFTAVGTARYAADVVPGRAFYVAVSGTYTGTVSVEYQTAPGVWVPFTPALALTSAAGQMTSINFGAHSEVSMVTSISAGSATIIFNTIALQERGRGR